MYALRLGSRRAVTASHIIQQQSLRKPTNVVLLAKRNHVLDKRNYDAEIDPICATMPHARPWDHYSLRANQNRQRRFQQYALWFSVVYLFWSVFKMVVIRPRLNKVERWDYQTKYWRDGYWVREFPEGLVVKEYANGKVSIEPGQTSRPSLPRRALNFIFRIGDTRDW